MKKTILTLLSVLFCAITFSQNVPQGINYQALARDTAGADLENDTLIVQFSIINSGSVSWQENHTVTTNDFGLFTAIIGNGTTTNGGSSITFDLIDWGAAAHSLKVEIDYGNGYLDMGTTDFMSVPYSLHAKTAANVDPTDELQSLSISGDTLSISSGNYIILPTITYGCTDSTASNYNSSAITDDGSCSYFLVVGDSHQGGIIFYLDGNGGGLIAAPTDQSNGADWGCSTTQISGADGFQIGTGGQNTIEIEVGCTTPGTAADICANLSLGGYSDWFLPSRDELNIMYYNIGQGNVLGLGNIGSFANGTYYSSTQAGVSYAWGQVFVNSGTNTGGDQYMFSKNHPSATVNFNVRAVRAFGTIPIAVNGCTDTTATNYNVYANTEDGSCTYPLVVGDYHQGGIIFYLDGNGGGLIVAPSDQSNGAEWGCYGTSINQTAPYIGAGNYPNTYFILTSGCAVSGIAADICVNLSLGGYSDWFLPSKDELNEMYLNLHQQGLGGFASYGYWSSTEYDNFDAWGQDFSDGLQTSFVKDGNFGVRAVRAF